MFKVGGKISFSIDSAPMMAGKGKAAGADKEGRGQALKQLSSDLNKVESKVINMLNSIKTP